MGPAGQKFSVRSLDGTHKIQIIFKKNIKALRKLTEGFFVQRRRIFLVIVDSGPHRIIKSL